MTTLQCDEKGSKRKLLTRFMPNNLLPSTLLIVVGGDVVYGVVVGNRSLLL